MTVRSRLFMLILLWMIAIVVSWQALRDTFQLASTNEAYTYIFLILPLSAALLYLDRAKVDFRAGFAPGFAALAMVPALAIGVWGTIFAQGARTSISMLALVTWWIGSVICCFGTKTFRALLFPLLFLFLLVPMPEQVLNSIVEFLQIQSAFAAQLMFHAIRVPATQDGVLLAIPGLEIEVASACSSIRSSSILFITTIFLAHVFLRTWWSKCLLIAASIPIAVLKNGFRIFTICELGTRFDRGFLEGNLHRRGGIVFWAAGVVMTAMLLIVLRRSEFQLLNRTERATRN